MTAPAGYRQLPSGFWVRDDGSGPYFVDVETGDVGQIGNGGGGGSGTVTNTGGALTLNNLLLGAGNNDVKRVPGLSSDGASSLNVGVAGSSVGKVAFANASSGSVTVQPVTGALGSPVLLLPALSGTFARTEDISDAVAGLKWKEPCRVATTVAGTLASSFENGDTVDGVVLATGNRILIKDQAAPAENGIYTVNASGAPTRTVDADTGTEILNASTLVTAGTANANKQFVCNTTGPITIDVTSLSFVQISVSGNVSSDSVWTAKGQLVVATGVGIAAALAPTTDGYGLVLDSAEVTGVKWAAPAITVDEDGTPFLNIPGSTAMPLAYVVGTGHSPTIAGDPLKAVLIDEGSDANHAKLLFTFNCYAGDPDTSDVALMSARFNAADTNEEVIDLNIAGGSTGAIVVYSPLSGYLTMVHLAREDSGTYTEAAGATITARQAVLAKWSSDLLVRSVVLYIGESYTGGGTNQRYRQVIVLGFSV